MSQQIFYQGIFVSEKLCSGTKVFNASHLVNRKFSLTPHQVRPSFKQSQYVICFHCCKAQVRNMDSGFVTERKKRGLWKELHVK